MNIEIIKTEGSYWSVICGDQFADHLCLDEALGTIAALMFGVNPRYLMHMENWYNNEYRHGNIELSAQEIRNRRDLLLTDQRVIAGHVIQSEIKRAPIREVSRNESRRVKNKTFPYL